MRLKCKVEGSCIILSQNVIYTLSNVQKLSYFVMQVELFLESATLSIESKKLDIFQIKFIRVEYSKHRIPII